MPPFIFRIPPPLTTLMLVHSNTFEGDTTFTDSGDFATAIVPATGAYHTTNKAKFGTSSFSHIGGDSGIVGSESNMAVGTGDFTVDLWAYRIGDTGSSGLFSGIDVGAIYTAPVAYTIGTVGNIDFSVGKNVYGALNSAGLVTVPLNIWTHYALVREAGLLSLYVNGVLFGPAVVSTENINSSSIAIARRFYDSSSYSLSNMYIDEFRYSNVARWSADFTPPTTPY